MRLSGLLSGLLALSANAQSTSFTDSRTQITFQAFQDPSGYTFGLALPTTPSTDFIGILIGGIDGWAGVSLGGSMVGKLLISAWPNGNSVITSFRKATAYAPPPAATGDYSIQPITNGTYINGTHFIATFLCKGCILEDGTTFSSSDTSGYLGWALSSTPPSPISDPNARLQYHDIFGQFGIDLAGAQSPNYQGWASQATAKLARRIAPFSNSTEAVKPKWLYRFRGTSGKKYE